MNRPRLIIAGIIILTVLAAVIDLPQIPLKVNAGPIKINTVLSGPKMNINVFGLAVKRDLDVKLGLDLQGGADLILRADVSKISAKDRDQALTSAKEVIERRVNALGVAEPVVQTSTVGEEYRIIVQLPGVQNIEEARILVGQTAKLDFREFISEKDNESFANTRLPIPTIENTKPTGIDGRDLKSASPDFQSATEQQQEGGPVVRFELKSEAADKFRTLTKRLIGRPLAIFLDNQILQAPTVQSEIGAEGIITGQTSESAKILAIQLSAGALPVEKIDIISERTIGPTLGKESINKSLLAGAVGLIVVGLFMVAYYGFLGLVATIALAIYTLLVLAIFKVIPVTLTLSGIAGFILSVGMAVDANILIFERTREELRGGRNQFSAMKIGFSRAWNSIRDSNVSSLITSTILFWFGTGVVKGFALALAIGILVSMFTAIVVTRTFLRFIYREKI